jgi:hypothetical protein
MGGDVETDGSVGGASRLLVAHGVARETPIRAPVKETVADRGLAGLAEVEQGSEVARGWGAMREYGVVEVTGG